MSFKSYEKISDNVYEVEMEIDASAFENAINRAYMKNKSKIVVAGFRKGKAPRKLVEKVYGENVFYEDALEIAYPEEFEKSIMATDLEPVAPPKDVSILEIGKDGVSISLKIVVKPEVEIGEYKGLKAVEAKTEVTDADIDAQIDVLRQRNARVVVADADHELKKMDTAVFDFEGFKGDEAFEGGKAENYELVIGSGQFIPGFEDQMVGKKAGEAFDVEVTFPEDYHAEDLAGQPVVFKVKINEIKIKEVPEVDDEFVKDVSEFDTVEELRNDAKAKIQEKKEADAKIKFENDLIDQLIEGMTGEIPEEMYERRINDNIQDFAQNLQAQGIDINTYLQFTGMEIGAFREGFKEKSVRQVKARLALEKLAIKDGYTPSEEEIFAERKALADAYGIDIEKITQTIDEKELITDIRVKKALDIIKDNAIATQE